MVTRAAANSNVVFLWNGILFGYDALPRLLVKLDAATEIFFRSRTQRLTFLQSKIRVYIHFKRAA